MKKIKDAIAALLYKLIIVATKLLPARKGEQHLLIIKLDEIGDYMLFRNLLPYFRQSEKYKGHKITLLGNAAWKPIFDEYDSGSVDDSVWITKKAFNKDLGYRFSMFRKVRSLKTSDVINCIYSRSFALDDGFAFVATGRHKIAMEGDMVNRGKNALNIDKYIYSEITDAGNERVFDAVRNSNFLGRILDLKNLPVDSSVKVSSKLPRLPEQYVAIFIGAGNAERKWPIDHFLSACTYAATRYNLATIVCGGPPDAADADKFMAQFRGKAYNYTAKTTLPEFMDLLSKARFMISVDTGPLHIGMAVGCPVIGLFSGKFYRRYAPYPKEIPTPLYPVYPDFIDKMIADDDARLYDPFVTKNNTIRLISSEKVTRVIDEIMT